MKGIRGLQLAAMTASVIAFASLLSWHLVLEQQAWLAHGDGLQAATHAARAIMLAAKVGPEAFGCSQENRSDTGTPARSRLSINTTSTTNLDTKATRRRILAKVMHEAQRVQDISLSKTLLNLDQMLAEVRTQVNSGDFELWVPQSNVSAEHVESVRQNNAVLYDIQLLVLGKTSSDWDTSRASALVDLGRARAATHLLAAYTAISVTGTHQAQSGAFHGALTQLAIIDEALKRLRTRATTAATQDALDEMLATWALWRSQLQSTFLSSNTSSPVPFNGTVSLLHQLQCRCMNELSRAIAVLIGATHADVDDVASALTSSSVRLGVDIVTTIIAISILVLLYKILSSRAQLSAARLESKVMATAHAGLMRHICHELRNPLQVLTVAIDSLREAFVDRHISKRFAQYRTASSSNRSLLADQSSMTAISMGPDTDTTHSNTSGPAFASTPELLSMAGTSVQSLLDLADAIHDLDAMRVGLAQIHVQPTDVSNLVRDAINQHAFYAKVPITTDIDPSTPDWIYTDPKRLRHVIATGVHNAVRYTDSGCIKVAVQVVSRRIVAKKQRDTIQFLSSRQSTGCSATCTSGRAVQAVPLARVKFGTDDMLLIEVIDSGKGLAQDATYDSVFGMVSTDTQTERTGLGLPLSKRVVEDMGGYIGLHGTPAPVQNHRRSAASVARVPHSGQLLQQLQHRPVATFSETPSEPVPSSVGCCSFGSGSTSKVRVLGCTMWFAMPLQDVESAPQQRRGSAPAMQIAAHLDTAVSPSARGPPAWAPGPASAVSAPPGYRGGKGGGTSVPRSTPPRLNQVSPSPQATAQSMGSGAFGALQLRRPPLPSHPSSKSKGAFEGSLRSIRSMDPGPLQLPGSHETPAQLPPLVNTHLALKSSGTNMPGGASALASDSPANHAHPRVLFVDDEPVNRTIGKQMLAKLHCRCDVLTDGDEVLPALEAAQRQNDPYSMVFMDIVMKRMSGVEALSGVLAAFPGLPVVAVTGNAGAQDVASYRSRGFAEVILKPFRASQLRDSMATHLTASE